MKSIVTYLAGFSLLTITTLSCSKDEQNQMKQQAETPQIISAKVPAGQTYVLNLGSESTASIQKQALHYQYSEVATAPNGNTAYKYIAAKGYAGYDEVTLQQAITATSRGRNCSRGNTEDNTTTTLKMIVIKFNVAN